MNKPNDDRLLERLVPAENRGCEPCPPLVNSPIPADEQNGSPAPVESPQRLEALAAPSWEDCERKFREMCAVFGKSKPKWTQLDSEYRDMLAAYDRSQEDGAAGGNVRLSDSL